MFTRQIELGSTESKGRVQQQEFTLAVIADTTKMCTEMTRCVMLLKCLSGNISDVDEHDV